MRMLLKKGETYFLIVHLKQESLREELQEHHLMQPERYTAVRMSKVSLKILKLRIRQVRKELMI